MRKLMVVVALAAGCRNSGPEVHAAAAGDVRAATVQGGWVREIDTLQARVVELEGAVSALDTSARSVEDARARFRAARISFKLIETLAAYYEPTTTRAINGPALPRVEEDEGPEAVFPPEGFQIIEELLFSDSVSARRERLVSEAGNLRALVTRLRRSMAAQAVTDARVWDAARLEIARIVTLGLAGFDSPVANFSLPEAASAMRGVRNALTPYASPDLVSALESSIGALDAAAQVDSLDRLAFIVEHANPLARMVARERVRLGIAEHTERHAFASPAATIFDASAFDTRAFAPPGASAETRERVALGRRLFFDTRLSDLGTRSCASCHQPARAFTDGRVRSAGVSATAVLRNAPTVINVGLQSGTFYDLRTTFLEDQVTDVMRNPNEMHGSVDAAAARLGADSGYRRAFSASFAGRADSAVTGSRLRSALAAYLRSLTALNSRVDLALRGDTAALTVGERRGFNLFMGKARCGTCHFAPLFSGTTPPNYQESEVEVIGVPSRAVTRGATVDPDSGRFRVTRAAPHLHAFKTPTLRNVALTAPYMHNGVYATLEQVVDFYDRGGGAGIGIRLDNQTLPAQPLRLTADERRALVAFMRALTDTAGLDRGPHAPR